MRGYPVSAHLSGFLCQMQLLLIMSLLVGQTFLELPFSFGLLQPCFEYGDIGPEFTGIFRMFSVVSVFVPGEVFLCVLPFLPAWELP